MRKKTRSTTARQTTNGEEAAVPGTLHCQCDINSQTSRKPPALDTLQTKHLEYALGVAMVTETHLKHITVEQSARCKDSVSSAETDWGAEQM